MGRVGRLIEAGRLSSLAGIGCLLSNRARAEEAAGAGDLIMAGGALLL
jgi:hypothetical protein